MLSKYWLSIKSKWANRVRAIWFKSNLMSFVEMIYCDILVFDVISNTLRGVSLMHKYIFHLPFYYSSKSSFTCHNFWLKIQNLEVRILDFARSTSALSRQHAIKSMNMRAINTLRSWSKPKGCRFCGCSQTLWIGLYSISYFCVRPAEPSLMIIAKIRRTQVKKFYHQLVFLELIFTLLLHERWESVKVLIRKFFCYNRSYIRLQYATKQGCKERGLMAILDYNHFNSLIRIDILVSVIYK